MAANPAPDEGPLFLGAAGEREYELLCAALEFADGFILVIVGAAGPRVWGEVRRRLAAGPLGCADFEAPLPDSPEGLDALLLRLTAPAASEAWRVLAVVATGDDDETRGRWSRFLHALNQHRNEMVRARRAPFLLVGPLDFFLLVHDAAPDLWSVRSHVFLFPDPPFPSGEATPAVPVRMEQRWPLAHELQDADYYVQLAEGLRPSPRPQHRSAHARLLARAADSCFYRGDWDRALRLLRREEQLPVYERLDDVRSKAVTM